MYEQITFPGLMTGSSNRFACAAFTAAANKPGEIYNPLWLYGPSGTGKTVLLRSALRQMQAQRPELRIRCIQAEEYVQKLIHAIQTDSKEEFQAWLDGMDVLAVDHLEILQGKVTTQASLAGVLAELADRGCQVILVSTYSPDMLEDLYRRLRDRCEWFQPADIHEPTNPERLSMVLQTARELELTLPDALVRRIVRDTHTHCHIRFVLNQLAVRLQLLGPDAGSLSEMLDILLERKVLS